MLYKGHAIFSSISQQECLRSAASSIALQCHSGDRSWLSGHIKLNCSAQKHILGLPLLAISEDEILVARCSDLPQDGEISEATSLYHCHVLGFSEEVLFMHCPNCLAEVLYEAVS